MATVPNGLANAVPYTWMYADAAARTSDTSLLTGDVGKWALQLDNATLWSLVNITPTWTQVASGGGFANPMTTAGDLILGGTAGAATRLAKGSDSQILTVDPTTHLPVWAAATGGGGGVSADFGSDGDIPFFTTYPNIGGDGNLAWNNGTKTLLANGDGDVLPVLISKANAAGGIGHSAEVAQVDGHPLQVLTPTAFTGNFLEWFINSVSQGAFPAAGGAYFTNAALSTSATSGFLGIPSCAGPPTGVPSGYPAGVIPLVWDSVNLKLYAYSGGAWKSSAVFT